MLREAERYRVPGVSNLIDEMATGPTGHRDATLTRPLPATGTWTGKAAHRAATHPEVPMHQHIPVRRVRALAIALCLALGAVLLAAAPASASTPAASTTYVRISPYHTTGTNLVAAVPSPYTTNGMQLQQDTYDDMHYYTQWGMTSPDSGKTYVFQNRWSHECLDVDNGSLDAGAAVVQEPCDPSAPSPSQQWIKEHDPYLPVWHIKNNQSKKYLAVADASFKQYAKYIQTDYSPVRTDQMMQIW